MTGPMPSMKSSVIAVLTECALCGLTVLRVAEVGGGVTGGGCPEERRGDVAFIAEQCTTRKHLRIHECMVAHV